jgi:acylphosphatase
MSSGIEGWFRPLRDGRMEILLKGRGLKVRCSGTEDEMNAFANLFEEKTGLVVNGPESGVFTRRRVGPKPIRGQLDLLEAPERLGVN